MLIPTLTKTHTAGPRVMQKPACYTSQKASPIRPPKTSAAVTSKTNASLPPLLVTSSIGVNAPYVKLADPQARLQHTLTSLERWLQIAPELRIVVCDGSGFDLTEICRLQFPNAHIECLAFENDFEAVRRYGKGYGEGQIVNHALQVSQTLSGADWFAKCTSKWWVRNFDQLVQEWTGDFQSGLKFKNKNSVRRISALHIDTRFYFVKKSFYLERLADAHLKVRDHEDYYLEHSFKDVLIRDNRDALRVLFATAPRIEGVSGTSAEVHGAGYGSLERTFKHAYRRMFLIANTALFAGDGAAKT